ncbi:MULTISPECIES: SCP2 sterol-binding domain-containing protein [unclassified Nonomuraea]|uniref:SCP2 sterol-binding domain-containing protein n=1 Tax=unclassified Nonomuraea TaxID=2593643 RepID=UPI003415B4E1
MSDARTRFEELRPVIDGSPQDELLSHIGAQPGGIDGVLGLVFELTPESFRAEKARKGEGTFQYEITTPEGPKFYHVSVDHGTCAVGQGQLDSPKVTIGVDLGDFLKMTTGKLAGPQAFMTGKLKVSGNTFFAMKWRDWFTTL